MFDVEGDCVAETAGGSPSTFLVGHDELPLALEQAMMGLWPGSKKSVVLEPDEAFGPWDPAAVITVELSELPPDAGVGDRFEAEHSSGESIWLRVLELREQEALLDLNHPLAGQKVRVDINLLAVRKADAEELERPRRRVFDEGSNLAKDLVEPGRLLRRGQER